MPTSKTINVYQDVPFWVKVRARGYWDKKTVLLYSSNNENQNMTMDVYDGLRYTATVGNNASVIDFSGTVLPYKWDYEDKLKDLRYYFLPVNGGQTITKYELNGTKVGTPIFDEDTGIASEFSTTNYIVTSTKFPTSFNIWEKVVCFTTSSDISTRQFIFSEYTDSGTIIGIYNSKLNLYASSGTTSWAIMNDIAGTTTLSTNTKYWVKMVYTGTQYITYLSTTGEFNGEETTENTTTNSTKITGGNYSAIGTQYYNGSMFQPFYGSIDLAETYIKINNEMWWKGSLSETKYNQYTITNTLESDLSDLSNCPSTLLDEDNFVIINGKLANGPKSYNVNNGYSYGYIEYTPSETLTITIKAYVSSEGGYDYGACYIGTQIYEATRSQINNGTTDGNGEWIFKISGSTSETSYTKELTGGTTYYIQFYYTKDGSAHGGSDRLFITALENFNNFVVTKTETLPGCFANYTDDGSAVTLNCFANGDTSVVLTPDNNYNGTYLGTVDIPSHINS